MARHRKSKRLLKLEEQLKAGVIAFLVSHGTRPGRFYDHELDTPAGLLHVTAYGDWIACRFDDVSLGRRFTDDHGPACNPYSGKWNFSYGSLQEFDPDQALAHFQSSLERLLNWTAAAI